MSFDLFNLNVGALVRDEAGVLKRPDLDFAIGQAVKRYSRAKPRVVVADIPGSGAFDYDMPAGWLDGFSEIEKIEYPAGQREPVYVDALDYSVYRSPSGQKLRFLAATPKAGETVRVTFSALHDVADDSTTIPDADFDIINNLAAGLACEQLASHYSNAMDATIGADAVDHKSKASEYAERAKRFLKLGTDLLKGLAGGDEISAAGANVSWGDGQDFLTHPER